MYILGNGGFAQELFYQLVDTGTYTLDGYIIIKKDEAFVINNEGITPFDYANDASFVLGTGNKEWRRLFLEHFLKKYPLDITHFPNVYDKRTFISPGSIEGCGNVYCPNVVINGNAVIGNFNCFNVYSTASHDNVIGDNNIFSPYSGSMGYCKIGNNNFIGTNAIITPKVSIGDYNTISAGEVLFDDLEHRQFFQSGVIYNKP